MGRRRRRGSRPPRGAEVRWSGGVRRSGLGASRAGPRHPRSADAWAERAKREGYPARSVYKLQEIDERLGVLRPGLRVLDLGAAPGSWSLYAARRIGPRGALIAVDLTELSVTLPAWAQVRCADAFDLSAEELGRFDVVLSDMAPATSGQRSLDQARSAALFEAALTLAEATLRPGGHFVGKLLEGPDLSILRSRLRAGFEQERLLRPRATRSDSSERFLVGLGRSERAATTS